MIERHDFTSKEALAKELATTVADYMAQAIETKGKASIALSGGSTPVRFFCELAENEDVDWSKVVVTLVDERWVNENSDRSNARLVKTNLLQGPARKAKFVPLYSGGDMPTTARENETYDRVLAEVPYPFDVVVLGMGNDGHTASFFPGGDALEQALNDEGPVVSIEAPGAGEPRITLTLPFLLKTAFLCLHIEGQKKADVLDDALDGGPVDDMPVRAVLEQTETPVHIYWCP